MKMLLGRLSTQLPGDVPLYIQLLNNITGSIDEVDATEIRNRLPNLESNQDTIANFSINPFYYQINGELPKILDANQLKYR